MKHYQEKPSHCWKVALKFNFKPIKLKEQSKTSTDDSLQIRKPFANFHANIPEDQHLNILLVINHTPTHHEYQSIVLE